MKNISARRSLNKKHDNLYRAFKKVNSLANSFRVPMCTKLRVRRSPCDAATTTRYKPSHRRCKNLLKDIVEEHGTDDGNTSTISGNSTYHEELEQQLELLKKPSGLLFTYSNVANYSTPYMLTMYLSGYHIISDSGSHACLMQGFRNSGALNYIFKHNVPMT